MENFWGIIEISAKNIKNFPQNVLLLGSKNPWDKLKQFCMDILARFFSSF